MVSAVHGILFECDISTQLFMLRLNYELQPSDRFVIEILDPSRLLVQPNAVDYVMDQLKSFIEGVLRV